MAALLCKIVDKKKQDTFRKLLEKFDLPDG